jgi:HEXXH motif-containing protein
MAMDDLAERIKASIENRSGDPWFPELTADLAARAWDSLHRDIGLTPDSYGTERVLSRSTSAPREVITSLNSCTPTSARAPAIRIEALTQESAAKYQEHGVTFSSADEILHTTILSCLEDALAIINQVPSLVSTVAALVRSLHVIKPADEDRDVSFSEPHIPFSIFVSVPEKRIGNDAFRVAEAIVHEAMHLQLTLIEQIVQLVLSDCEKYFSPWRGEHRTAQGVLHALYVFAVIDCLIANLQSRSVLPIKSAGYLKGRRRQIDNQMREIEGFRYYSSTTESGKRFVRRLFRR